MFRTMTRAGVVLPLALVATSAAALITNVSNVNPDVTTVQNSSTMRDVREHGVNADVDFAGMEIYLFDEKQCIHHDSVSGTVPLDHHENWDPNRPFSCHLLFHPFYHNPLPDTLTIDFDEDIIGFISTSTSLDNSDDLCGLADIVYPTYNTEPERGIESGVDSVMATGPSTAVIMTDGGYYGGGTTGATSDTVRIITECTTAP